MHAVEAFELVLGLLALVIALHWLALKLRWPPATALLVGGETFALMSIFGLEYAPLLAVLVGMTNIVPVLGPFLGAVPGIVILLLEAPWKAAEFAIIIFVVQQVDGNFIAPRILGGATGLDYAGVRAFLKSQGLALDHVLFDEAMAVPRHYGTAGIPVTLFLHADGRLAKAHMGEIAPEQIATEIARLH